MVLLVKRGKRKNRAFMENSIGSARDENEELPYSACFITQIKCFEVFQ